MTARTRIIIIAAAVIGGSVLLYFGFLVGAAVTGYRAVIQDGNGTATLQNLKTIAAAEAWYFNSRNRTFGTLDQLIGEGILSSKFSAKPAVADGYVFTLSLVNKPDGASWYKINADPQNESSGTNHFYLDSSDSHIRVNADRQAGPTDPDL